MFLKILNIFIFIIVCMRVFGKIMKEDGQKDFQHLEILKTYGKEYKCIFVGDASMSPYEILMPGGGNEHYNDELEKFG